VFLVCHIRHEESRKIVGAYGDLVNSDSVMIRDGNCSLAYGVCGEGIEEGMAGPRDKWSRIKDWDERELEGVGWRVVAELEG
jgi:hypothetical protein